MNTNARPNESDIETVRVPAVIVLPSWLDDAE